MDDQFEAKSLFRADKINMNFKFNYSEILR